jgi:hypothetical protein
MLNALIGELIDGCREHVELIHLAGDGLTPTPYEAGLAAPGLSWADLGLPVTLPITVVQSPAPNRTG